MSWDMYLLRIVKAEPPYDAVQLPGHGPLEINLIDSVTNAIVKRGVGFFKTEAKVRTAIRDGLIEAIQALKEDTRYVPK